MALNFPNSPSNADIYQGFTYNSTKGAWTKNEIDNSQPRNHFINGNLGVWQRATTISASGFAADRWKIGIDSDKDSWR